MRLLMYAAVLVLFATGALALSAWLMPARPGVTRSNFERVQDGMTLAEVSAVLGEPSDVSPGGRAWGALHDGPRPINYAKHVWGGDTGGVYVMFDEKGGASYREWQDPPTESSWRRLRRWLGLA